MTKTDIQIITRKAKFIQEDLNRLSQYSHISLAAYLKDYDTQLKVERLLEKIVGRVIDINYHLLKTKHQFIPIDYFDSFLDLANYQEIPRDLANQLAPAAGLRNALAHEYDYLDPQKVHAAISLALTQIPQYLFLIFKNLT